MGKKYDTTEHGIPSIHDNLTSAKTAAESVAKKLGGGRVDWDEMSFDSKEHHHANFSVVSGPWKGLHSVDVISIGPKKQKNDEVVPEHMKHDKDPIEVMRHDGEKPTGGWIPHTHDSLPPGVTDRVKDAYDTSNKRRGVVKGKDGDNWLWRMKGESKSPEYDEKTGSVNESVYDDSGTWEDNIEWVRQLD